jgi:hypothetical protein
MNTDNLLTEITATLKPYDIEKIILFGSYAYGIRNIPMDYDKSPSNKTK